ncbi:MAG TPA: phage virion morphogenesis protein [Saprospiraceae bacterium]|nr:phage virion morphogenesis protein [Saprospiraceae bacterium]HMP14445.1 phage virion morphogenesis protein [Saprospiraceae bacterium]
MPRQKRVDFPNFSNIQADINFFVKKLPDLVGNTAVNFYKDSWNREGFIDTKISKWKPRKRTTGKQRRILVKSGRLRRSLRYRNLSRVVAIFTDVPYAQVHNEGGKLTARQKVKAHTRKTKRGSTTVKSHIRNVNFTMPQRQFMDVPGKPISRLLQRRIIALTERAIEKIINKM